MVVLWLALLTPLSYAQDAPVESAEESRTVTPPEPADPDVAPQAEEATPEPPPVIERPLAIPTQVQPPTPLNDGPPPAQSGMSGSHSLNLRTYRDRYLAVRSYRQLTTQTTMATMDAYGRYPYYGWGVNTAPTTLVRSRESWGVYQGPVHLDNLDYLSAVGRAAERQMVEQDIRKKRSVARAMGVVLGAGIAGSLVGAVGMDAAGTQSAYTQWRAVSIGGLVAVVAGAVGTSLPASRSQALTRDLEQIRSLTDVQREVAEYNERLRVELQLTEDEALSLER